MKKHLGISKEATMPENNEGSEPLEKSSDSNRQLAANKEPSLMKRGRYRLARLLGLRGNGISIEEEVADLIEEHDPEGKQVGSEERSMLHNVFSLSDTCVSDVMVPRPDIVAVDANITLDELKNVLIEEEHTRIPVYRDSLDNIAGFIHIKDLLLYLGSPTKKNFEIENILREMLFVPPSMKVIDLLQKMQSKRVHMAVVLDEYGATDGLVTMEDLVEEIIGDVEDEHDNEEPSTIRKIDDFTFEVEARTPIEELEEKLHLKLVDGEEAEDFDTLGGLVFYLLGQIPAAGEKVKHKSGVEFEVTEADARKILKLIVHTPQNIAADQA